MHRRSLRRLAAAAVALLAATASLAMASPAGEATDAKEPVRRVVRKVAGPGEDHLIRHPLMAFHGRGPLLGVAFVPLTPELRKHFGAPEDAGVLVSKVVADSAAQAAGIEVGDILLRVDGKAVSEGFELGRLIHERQAGETVAVELLRGGRTQTVSATLKESAAPEMLARKVIALHCQDESGAEKECPAPPALAAFDCDDSETCEVKVICEDAGACTCTVNGEDQACPEGVGPGSR